MIDYQTWRNNTVGHGWDMDGTGDWDCVDIPKSWAVALYGDWVNTVGYGNAKDLFANASDQYFDKIVNDHNNPNQLPVQGDIMVFGPTPAAGYTNTFVNPYGHTGVVDSADQHGYTIISQASGTRELAEPRYNDWHYRPCIGWLRPKNIIPAAPAAPHYSITPISPINIHVVANKYKWNLAQPNWNAVVDNPITNSGDGLDFTAVATLTRTDPGFAGYVYYLEDANTPHGWNKLDCAVIEQKPMPAPPPTGALPYPGNGDNYTVVVPLDGYLSATQAGNHSGSATPIEPGDYAIYRYYPGNNNLINITKDKSKPGWWINAADNHEPEPEPIPEQPKIFVGPRESNAPEPQVLADSTVAEPQTYKPSQVPIGTPNDTSWQAVTFFYPDGRAVPYKALEHLVIKEYTGRRKAAVKEAGQQINFIGTFEKNGVKFYCPRSDHDEHFIWRFGVPMTDDDGNATVVKITSDLPPAITIAHLFELWAGDAKAYLGSKKIFDVFFRK